MRQQLGGRKRDEQTDRPIVVMVVEDNELHRFAVISGLRQLRKRWRGLSILEFTQSAKALELDPLFEAESVRRWMEIVSNREQATTPGVVLLAVIDLSWHDAISAESPPWLGTRRVDMDYLKLLLCPEELQPRVSPDLLSDGLKLLDPQRETSWKTIILSAFGLESLRLLAERRGAAYTIQKYPDLQQYYRITEDRQLLRSRFDEELSSGLRRLQRHLIQSGSLKFPRRADGRIDLRLNLESLAEAHHADCICTLRQLYHCGPAEDGVNADDAAEDWKSLPLDTDVIRRSLAAYIDLAVRPAEPTYAEHAVEQRNLIRTALINSVIPANCQPWGSLKYDISRYARSRDPVLIVGGEGSGKTAIAQLLHDVGGSPPEKYHRLPAADGSTEKERALRGSDSGPPSARAGIFERAKDGTVCIDQLDYLGFAAQTQLLSALRDGVITRIGPKARPVRVQARLILTASKTLHSLHDEQRLHPALYEFLSGKITDPHEPLWLLAVPSLADCLDEFPTLVKSLCESARQGLPSPAQFTDEALERFGSLSWPRNYKDLYNCLQRLCEAAQGHRIDPELVESVHHAGVLSQERLGSREHRPTQATGRASRTEHIGLA